MTSKQLLLGALLGVLVLALGYAYWASPSQERAVQASRPSSNSKRVQTLSSVEGPTDQRRVRLDILARRVEAFSEPKRDIFRLLQPRPVLPAVPPPLPMITVAPPVVRTPIVMSTPSPVRVPSFTLLGFLQKEEERTVFLSLNNHIFIVKKGTRFGNNKEFIAEKMTKKKLVIRQDRVSEAITVSLSDFASEAIATSFKRPVVTGRPTASGKPVFKRPRHRGVTAADDGGEDVVSKSATTNNLWRKPMRKGLPAVIPAAEKTDDNMSSLQLRSVLK
jgi:hypothetical protein